MPTNLKEIFATSNSSMVDRISKENIVQYNPKSLVAIRDRLINYCCDRLRWHCCDRVLIFSNPSKTVAKNCLLQPYLSLSGWGCQFWFSDGTFLLSSIVTRAITEAQASSYSNGRILSR